MKILVFILFFWLLAGQADAVPLSGFKNFSSEISASKARVNPFGTAGAGSSVGSVAPPANMSGWTPAGNYGAAASASGATMTMSGSGNVFMAGTKYPFQAGYTVPTSFVVEAVVALASGGPAALAATIAIPLIAEWIANSGGRVNPSTGSLERSDPAVCSVSPCYEYSNDGFQTVTSFSSAAGQFCAPMGGILSSNIDNSTVRCKDYPYDSAVGRRSSAPKSASWLPSSMDDIAPYMSQHQPNPQVIQSILDKGGDIKLPDPVITGPSSLDGPSSTTTNPDGSKSITTSKYNFTTNGNTITNTDNSSTVTVVNVDNSTRSVSTTSSTPSVNNAPEPVKDPCDANPDRAGCSKLGNAPDAEKIPSQSIPVTMTPVIFAAPAACPAPLSGVIHVGTFFKSWSITYQPMCDLMVNLRLLFLAIGAVASAWIFMEGFKP